MTEPDGRPPRRRRRPQRQTGAGTAGTPAEPLQQGSATPAPAVRDDASAATPSPPSGPAKSHGDSAKGRRDGEPSRGHGRDSERGWRELAGSSPSQVGLSGALRARDVARPTAEDLAAAERSITVVRRHWQPPEA